VNAWFSLGHCCAQIKDFQKAAHAYHRCVNIDADNFEAWNNLADAYICLGQNSRAYAILQVGLKHCFVNYWFYVTL